jgi:hypothetical protein
VAGSGVGVRLALASAGPAKIRGRQAVPLQRYGYRQIGPRRSVGVSLSIASDRCPSRRMPCP